MSALKGERFVLFGAPAIEIAWICALGDCAAYVVARSSSIPALFLAAQFLFLVPVFAAALLTLEAYRVGPPGDERKVWGLLSVAAWLLAGGESYFSWYQIAVNPAGPAAASLTDWLNLAAACVFLLLLAIASGLGRRPPLVRLRFLADAVAVMILSLLVLFRFWSGELMGQLGWFPAVRWAIYSFFGIAMLGTVLWLAFGLRRAGRPGQRRNLLVGLSVGIFAVGVIVAPFIPGSSEGTGLVSWVVVLTSVFFMVGYAIMAIAAVMRVVDRREPWQAVMSRPSATESEWTTAVMSLCVLVAVCLAAVWAYNALSIEVSTVYFLLGLTATFAMVARTAILSFETGVLKESVGTDPVTGVGNMSAFEDRLETAVLLARRAREPFVLAVVNLDDFSRVNEVLGRAAGDQVLVQVGRALTTTIGKNCEAFRLVGDEFAVIARGFGLHDRAPIGSDLLAAVSDINPGRGLVLSASIGVVSCDDALPSSSELIRDADAAQVWAKYHGKGRVVVHDDRIVRALGVEERLRLNDARLHYDVARALAASADARDSRSVYHSRNVAALSVLLGEAAGLEDEQLRTLEIAAMLHDVGQIALPDELVVGPLSPSRRLAAREHAILGAQLVDSVGVEGAAAAVRGHHERWDGFGYPDGLSGNQIALESRIIALADAYDGMTSGRRSGTNMSRAAALQEIDHALGTRFDPILAERFIRLVGTTSSLGWSDEWAVQE
jgi:diguanylate cyclase (GGDEF)-like protein